MNVIEIAAECQEALKAAERFTPSPDLVVFSTTLPDGRPVPLCRFGDDNWELPPAVFPKSYQNPGQRRLIFAAIPAPFRQTLKLCVLRYAYFGLEGSKPARGTTIYKFVRHSKQFLEFLQDIGLSDLTKVTPMHCAQFVKRSRTRKVRGKKAKALSAQGLQIIFSAVERLHKLSQHTPQPMPHPWPDSSAFFLSGNTAPSKRVATTLVIPDDDLSRLFQCSEQLLERADYLLGLRDRLEELQRTWSDRETIRLKFRKEYPDGLEGLKEELRLLLGACMSIVFIGSGIRSHEMGYLETGCAYTTVDHEGYKYYWIRGQSDKTAEGRCSWLVPEITHRAIAIAELVTRPLREQLLRGLVNLHDDNNEDPRLADRDSHKNALFITRWTIEKDYVTTMNHQAQNRLLNKLAKHAGIEWSFTTHQFRRTFAVYAARSSLGDLRYLREHFKHWSIDMTALYAAAQDRDEDLFDEVGQEIQNQKVNVVQHWLEKDTMLSGGMADSIRSFRSNSDAVETYEDRRELAMKLSELVAIRATGVAWCTADNGGCNGGKGVERTRCAGCVSAVIDDRKRPVWQGIYSQQLELSHIDDIGPGGQARVQRDTEHCRKVLIDLGAKQEDLADVAV